MATTPKRNQNQSGNKGPLARDANPERYGGGAMSGADSGNTVRQRELTERRQNDPGSLTEDEAKELATLENLGGVIDLRAGDPNPGDPGNSAREMSEQTGQGADRHVDRSTEFDQSLDRDLQIEGLHDGPGGRRYLVLNLSDDQDALVAAKAYGEAVRQSKPDLAAELLQMAVIDRPMAGDRQTAQDIERQAVENDSLR